MAKYHLTSAFGEVEQPFPEGFTLSDIADAGKRRRLCLAFSINGSDDLEALNTLLEEETGDVFGVVWHGGDCHDGYAVTFDEANAEHEDVKRGNYGPGYEPGDGDGYQWYDLRHFPTHGYEDEHYIAIIGRHLKKVDDSVHDVQVNCAVTRFLSSRMTKKK